MLQYPIIFHVGRNFLV